MNKPKYVFSQLVAFMDSDKFRHIVDKYDGNRYVKHFTCWNQLLTLMCKRIRCDALQALFFLCTFAYHFKICNYGNRNSRCS